eukprot:Skav225496  [mRNA]  locus=scaffold6730:13502:15547:+ [translate_table: standard]
MAHILMQLVACIVTLKADDLKGILGEHFEGTDAKELIKEALARERAVMPMMLGFGAAFAVWCSLVMMADTNGDGMIEYDEFLNYFNSHDVHVEEDTTQRGLVAVWKLLKDVSW